MFLGNRNERDPCGTTMGLGFRVTGRGLGGLGGFRM